MWLTLLRILLVTVSVLSHTDMDNQTQSCDCWNHTSEEQVTEIHFTCHCLGEQLTSVPRNLNSGHLQTLSISHGSLTEILDDTFLPYRFSLKDLTVTHMKYLRKVEKHVFKKLLDIQSVTISQAPNLQSLPDHLFSPANSLKVLRVIHTGLLNIPAFSTLGSNKIMHMVDFEGNRIQALLSNGVRLRTEQFLAAYNNIQKIESWAFNGSEIGKLSLRGNPLTELSIDAFRGLRSLRDLDLSETQITFLPVAGLEELEFLYLINTYTLKVIPSIYDLKSLLNAELTYSFHCCAFYYPARHDPDRHAKHQEYLAHIREFCATNERPKRESEGGFGPIITEGFAPVIKGDKDYHPFHENRLDNGEEDGWSDIETAVVSNPNHLGDEVFHQFTAKPPQSKLEAMCGNLSLKREPVKCFPVPDALNPCEDIMGYKWLRMSVWIVISTAFLGNTAVLTVLLSSHSETSVPRFLMCHLAFADLCMAIYLLLLATTDLRSTGVYFNYAFDWQRGIGCQIAGFMTVFASQLSIFTLSLLTVERWFAIRHALYTNKVGLKLAAQIMAVGWIYAILAGALPLFGISSYSSTSICLPMDTHNTVSVIYILFLLAFTGGAFVLICICYAQIYLSLGYETRHSPGEKTVARKMTLLVGTNFACWAPIAFFSLTAVAGYPLIDVTRSKILLVFFYPINSCANPYLYAILTAQYRKDFVQLLARYGLCIKCAEEYKMVYTAQPVHQRHINHPPPLLHAESRQTAEVAV